MIQKYERPYSMDLDGVRGYHTTDASHTGYFAHGSIKGEASGKIFVLTELWSYIRHNNMTYICHNNMTYICHNNMTYIYHTNMTYVIPI